MPVKFQLRFLLHRENGQTEKRCHLKKKCDNGPLESNNFFRIAEIIANVVKILFQQLKAMEESNSRSGDGTGATSKIM